MGAVPSLDGLRRIAGPHPHRLEQSQTRVPLAGRGHLTRAAKVTHEELVKKNPSPIVYADIQPPSHFWTYLLLLQGSLVHPGHPPLKHISFCPEDIQASCRLGRGEERKGCPIFSILQAKLPISNPKSSKHNHAWPASLGYLLPFQAAQGMKGLWF